VKVLLIADGTIEIVHRRHAAAGQSDGLSDPGRDLLRREA